MVMRYQDKTNQKKGIINRDIPLNFFLRPMRVKGDSAVLKALSRAAFCKPDGPIPYPDRFLSSIFYACYQTPRFFSHRKGADFLRNPTLSSVPRLIWNTKSFLYLGNEGASSVCTHGYRNGREMKWSFGVDRTRMLCALGRRGAHVYLLTWEQG